MAHGGGGRQMHQLIENLFISKFDSDELKKAHDGAIFPGQNKRYAYTTDSFVVHPLFFPGGNIGSLAVYGTVNDLAMCGAKPLYMSTGFIIEEGFSIEVLTKIVGSMKTAADRAGVKIVTGDTKIVEHGKCDGVYINTSGVGIINHDLDISPTSIRPGDAILINRDIGRHGIAVMSIREGFQFETNIESDCAPLAETVMRLIDNNINIKCLRDLTRGGLASALTELAGSSRLHFSLEENCLPVSSPVNNACEILGLDPLLVANEGAFLLFVSSNDAEKTRNILQSDLDWPDASIIGRVVDDGSDLVTLKLNLGTERIITMPAGEQLPRIC
ncbi:MAG: hydrogenase expression/formation protein HypE [Candidatus Zixiibacteriota bacterium]